MPADEAMQFLSEEELWRFLESFLDQPSDFSGTTPIALDGWRPELFYFPDEKIGHAVSPPVAHAILAFHKSLSRSYAYLAYGEANARRLRQDDKELLDGVRFVATDGSNGLDIPYEIINVLLTGVTEKMTGEQITVFLVVFILLYFSQSVARDWINKHYEAKRQVQQSKEREALSSNETRRMEIFAKALTQYPDLKKLQEEADESRMELVRAAQNFGRSRVVGGDLTQEEAEVILSRNEQEGAGKRIDGKFEVVQIKTKHEQGFIFRLHRVESDETIPAEANHSELTTEDIHSLFAAAEKKNTIHALVNAWYEGEKLVRAVIMSVNSVS